MGDELSKYLQGSYRDERRETERVTKTCSRLLDAFDRLFIDGEAVWPYEVVDRGGIGADDKFSFSTNAMIVFALAVATGRVSKSALLPVIRQAPIATKNRAQTDRLLGKMEQALALFPEAIHRSRKGGDESDREQRELWVSTQKERGGSTDVQVTTASASFGPNDPLTLTWLLELLGNHAPDVKPEDDLHGLRQELLPVAKEIITTTFKQPDLSPLRLPDREQVPHAFPLLRVIHLSRTPALEEIEWEAPRPDLVHEYLLNKAHFHLSSAALQSGGFDAGELAFSLEGVLLCDPSPDYSLFDRAFDVLADRQKETPYWRPLRPFRVTSQGMVLLPQSVEIANSLLRICSRLDGDRDRSYFSDRVDLFKEYTRWLESRMFNGKAGEPPVHEFCGWQSEHTFAGGRIHLWQTSQVLLYLMHYATMLQGHIARVSFREARFSVESLSSIEAETAPSGRWLEREPMASLPDNSPFAVYHRIGERIIDPRASGARPSPWWSSSALLYGPPGTGKSTIAKEMARALGYGLVTITPSDFITAGQEGADARAKNIFTTLMEQSDLVVLFDEVDQLLLDREGDLYRDQGDIFKLIVPGMLTKLNELTKHKDVVFVVATNYFERIDRAIRRPGRIDEQLLVLPPDAQQRMRFLTVGGQDGGPLVPGWGTLGSEARDVIVAKTALYSYGEFLDLAKGTKNQELEGDDLQREILTRIEQFPPTISVASYKNRVMKNAVVTEEAGLIEELVMVVYIAAESGQVKVADREWLSGPLAKALSMGAPSASQVRVWDSLRVARLLDSKDQA